MKDLTIAIQGQVGVDSVHITATVSVESVRQFLDELLKNRNVDSGSSDDSIYSRSLPTNLPCELAGP